MIDTQIAWISPAGSAKPLIELLIAEGVKVRHFPYAGPALDEDVAAHCDVVVLDPSITPGKTSDGALQRKFMSGLQYGVCRYVLERLNDMPVILATTSPRTDHPMHHPNHIAKGRTNVEYVDLSNGSAAQDLYAALERAGLELLKSDS